MDNPAKYTDSIVEEMRRRIASLRDGDAPVEVLDPFAGTGKVALVKEGAEGIRVVCNDLEPEWDEGRYGVDEWHHCDAEALSLGRRVRFIATSPTYGNRMADHHVARDGSRRMTYTHCLGRRLSEGNTGAMQWGVEYRSKHEAIFRNLMGMLEDGGYVLVNVSNHIRKGEEVDVVGWWRGMLLSLGLEAVDDVEIATPRMRFGRNGSRRVSCEHLLVYRKPAAAAEG